MCAVWLGILYPYYILGFKEEYAYIQLLPDSQGLILLLGKLVNNKINKISDSH
jgi:hypothetical protein